MRGQSVREFGLQTLLGLPPTPAVPAWLVFDVLVREIAQQLEQSRRRQELPS